MTNGDKIRSMTDEELREKVWIKEAVYMVMERLEEALKDGSTTDCLTKFCPNCGAKMEGGHNP